MRFSKFRPAVPRRCLMLMAGLMWSAVGILLCRMAFQWLHKLSFEMAMGLGVLGAIAAWGAGRFGFSRIANKNIHRLCRMPESVCIFAFQAWKSYLLIAFMIGLGITLRRSPVPREILAVIYMTVGGGLLLASSRYYQNLRRKNTGLRH